MDVPSAILNDTDFLDAFDHFFMEAIDGRPIGAGELESIVQLAFDQATDSDDMFMPFHWRDVLSLTKSDTADWFIRRAGQLIHRKAA